ncbi:MAG: hypothetical protein IAI50_11140 [Candidatus Eremiobacteraeota bacterium]|nr:hypothetical protein [Candidatus Eremiobacteraeota bacterium]
MYLRGWAFLTEPPRAADAAVAAIDGGEPFDLDYNQPRPDVENVFGLPPLPPIGFHGVRSFVGLALGPHVLRVALVDRASQTLAAIDAAIDFEIVDGAFAFTATQRVGRQEMTIAVDASSASSNGSAITLRGWAIDRRFTTAASDVYACVDGTMLVRGIIGTLRADVATQLQSQTIARCGYVIRIDTSALAAGEHVVEVRAIAADGDRYAVSDAQTFVVA